MFANLLLFIAYDLFTRICHCRALCYFVHYDFHILSVFLSSIIYNSATLYSPHARCEYYFYYFILYSLDRNDWMANISLECLKMNTRRVRLKLHHIPANFKERLHGTREHSEKNKKYKNSLRRCGVLCALILVLRSPESILFDLRNGITNHDSHVHCTRMLYTKSTKYALRLVPVRLSVKHKLSNMWCF